MKKSRYILHCPQALRRISRIIATTPLSAALAYICLNATMSGCRIEPPLNLPDDLPVVHVAMGDVITDLNVIWDIESEWYKRWWYGWDETDIANWGEIAYPEPSNFEGRFYYYGEIESFEAWQSLDRMTIYETPFTRRFDFGFHNMLLWSNIDSEDGTQALIINEEDPDNIHATTSRSRVGYMLPPQATTVHNNPEIFYSGSLDRFYISRDTLDYDYYDPDRKAWVKEMHTSLNPLVYIYLVQLVVYNNNDRIIGINDRAAITSMADGVNVQSGHTSNSPVSVIYPMRLKHGLPARDGRMADIFGGKLTTFGLCDMESWARSRATPLYAGSRTDLTNHLMVDLNFYNYTDSVYEFVITDQLQKQVHGGLITIEVDADTLTIPRSSEGVTGGFDPVIAPSDTIEHQFEM